MALDEQDKQWFREQLDEERRWTLQQLERGETTLLTEFHKLASPAEARSRTISAALRAIDLEMEALSDRVKKLEDQRPH